MTTTRRSARINKGIGGVAAAKNTTHLNPVQWEWEGDGGWMTFDSRHSTAIGDAFRNGKSDIVLEVAKNVKMKLSFSSMSQENLRTGWKRAVRCVSSPPSLSPPSPGDHWEWEDGQGKWSPYLPPVQRLLDACLLCHVPEWEVEAQGRRYRVELGAGPADRAQVNIETSVKRKVRYTDGGGGGGDNSDACAGGETGGEGDEDGGGSAGGDTCAGGETGGGGDEDGGGSAGGDVTAGEDSGAGGDVTAGEDSGAGGDVTAGEDSGGEATTKMTQGRGVSGRGVAEEKIAAANIEETDSRVLVTYKGRVPVDYECRQKIGKAHVFTDDAGLHWDATLNQTNLKNNNNKFYILQLLEDNSTKNYSVWFRWGRVGLSGQHSIMECGSDLEQAQEVFCKKFQDKTCNRWLDRDTFVKHAGKYDLLMMDYEPPKDETDMGEPEESEASVGGVSVQQDQVKSKLDMRLQSLIELICNVKAMEEAVLEMKYDANKAPLGKLTDHQVKCGYAALKKIESCVDRNHFGDFHVQACDEFYTRIPHHFGMRRPPLIKTKQEIREKISLLEMLSDIQIAMKIISDGGNKKVNPIDSYYQDLNCTLTPVDHEEDDFRMVEKYLLQTHAKIHNQYRLELLELFRMKREGEADQFKDVGNRHLLWHGSRLSNWVGILSQGLRIAPPEAPITGYMFGKGLYFADMSSKSSNYCLASRAKNEGLVLLCDVSLGSTQDLLGANHCADQLPKGKHSTKGLGKIVADPTHDIIQPNGCKIPLGPAINTGVHNTSGYTLNFNEYIVYDSKQVTMKYLLRLKFHFV